MSQKKISNRVRLNILSTASGGLSCISFFKTLKLSDLDFELQIADIKKDVHLSKFLKYHQLPLADDKNYIQTLKKIILAEKINVLVPNYTDELPVIAKNKGLFEKMGVHVVVSNYESIENSINKSKCYEILSKKNIDVPEFYLVKDASSFKSVAKRLGYPKYPICFKPARHPHGSGRGFRILDNRRKPIEILFYDKPNEIYDSFERITNLYENGEKLPELLVMEYLPGREFSVYVLAFEGEALYVVPNLRQELFVGYSSAAEVVNNPEVINIAKKITKLFNFSYNVNIQIKYSRDGRPKIVEINPRLAGTVILPVAAGINMPAWAIKLAIGQEIPKNQPIKYGTKMERYWTEIFTYRNKTFTLDLNL